MSLFSRLTIAITSALAIGAIALGADALTQPELAVAVIDRRDMPTLDGDISDEVWAQATPTAVLTQHGGDFGGQGKTEIEVRAVHDGRNIYLSFVWEDPTRSLLRTPLIKEGGTWHIVQTGLDNASEHHFYDDRLAIMLAGSGPALIGAAIHLGLGPLEHMPRPKSQRGFHYTSGALLDVWEWSAVGSGVANRLQDDFLGPPLEPTKAQWEGETRYTGGFSPDPGAVLLTPNFAEADMSNASDSVRPLRLPTRRHSGAQSTAIGLTPVAHVPLRAQSDDPGLTMEASVPYSSLIDSLIPDGAVIPGVVVDGSRAAGSGDVAGVAKWAAGRWVLEVRRTLQGGENDVPIGSGTLMWLAAFDHSQSRHTYHLRPLKLELE